MDKVFVLGAAFQNDAIADGWGNEGDMVINANDFRSTTESIGVALNDLVDRDLEISFIMLMLHAKPSPLWSTNLTAACTDPANLFQASNVYNCMQIAAHALLVQNGSMFVNESTFADPELAGVVVPDLNTFDGGKVLETVVDCAINSCGDQTLGSCMPSVLALKGIKATADSLQMISDGLVTYCDGAQSIYNADIAGPGVRPRLVHPPLATPDELTGTQ
ncbi:hypothetical protein GQ53DRAFT_437849 [Thozetella sp. PMI_491]|nr:hypothetical protein GQ53DRAFT_437849 [Thozetella sp. PMI_491]